MNITTVFTITAFLLCYGLIYGQLSVKDQDGNHIVCEKMLGYRAVLDCVKENGENSAEEIKQPLFDLGTAWLDGIENQDDITVMVVKKTDNIS